MLKLFLGQSIGFALVAQWIEHLTTDQKVGGSSPFERASGPARCVPPVGALLYPLSNAPTRVKGQSVLVMWGLFGVVVRESRY